MSIKFNKKIVNGTKVYSTEDEKEGVIEGLYPEGYKVRWSRKNKFDYSYRHAKHLIVKTE